MFVKFAAFIAMSGAVMLITPAHANSLTVSPTSIIIHAPQQIGLLTLRAGGPEVTVGQVRVFAMDMQGGKEVLSTTKDVVVSPPAMRLQPDQEITVRLVRKTNRAIRGTRECYRVLVDQLPQKKADGGSIGFVIRQSIPMCFMAGS